MNGTVTFAEIFKLINKAVVRSERSIRADMAALKIRNVGVRQCPQRYPANTARRILKRLGL